MFFRLTKVWYHVPGQLPQALGVAGRVCASLPDWVGSTLLGSPLPKLLPWHASARLAWALGRRDWTLDPWKKFIWSDECSVERSKGGGAKWYGGGKEKIPMLQR